VTNEPETSPRANASVPFSTRIVRLRNLLLQGAVELAAPLSVGEARADEVLEVADKGIVLHVAATDQRAPIGPEILAALAERADRRPLDLVFKGNSCIDVSFTVPTAPLPDLRRIVETELQFRSPFAEDVSLSFWSAKELPDGRWQVRAAVLLKAKIAALLAELQTHGLTVGAVWREGAAASFGARPAWAVGPSPDPSLKEVLFGLPSTVKLTLGGSALFLASAAALTLSLSLGAGRLGEAADAARAELGAEAQASASIRSLDSALARSTDRLAMTGLLSDRLPDGFWLDQLAIEQDTVTLTGFGPSAAEVTRLLSTLPMLSDIAFASPVTRDNTQSLERYRIAATLAGAAP
jgi:Fimbrial assembly protein (PilN)